MQASPKRWYLKSQLTIPKENGKCTGWNHNSMYALVPMKTRWVLVPRRGPPISNVKASEEVRRWNVRWWREQRATIVTGSLALFEYCICRGEFELCNFWSMWAPQTKTGSMLFNGLCMQARRYLGLLLFLARSNRPCKNNLRDFVNHSAVEVEQ